METGSPDNLTEDELGFLKARRDYLTPGEKEIFLSEVKASDPDVVPEVKTKRSKKA
jgi:hypothetical protein